MYMTYAKIKNCKYCGKEFVAKNPNSNYCSDEHFATCPICDKSFKFDNKNLPFYTKNKGNVTCSKECKKLKVKQTNLELFGVENPSQSSEIQKKKEQTSLLHYGVKHPGQSEQVKMQKKQTCLAKYGTKYTFQAESVKDKIKDTMMQKYGVEHALQNEALQNRAKSSTLLRYGVDHAMQSDLVKEKLKVSLTNKYGVDNPMKSDDIKQKVSDTKTERYGDATYNNREKAKETYLAKYGYTSPTMSEEVKEKTRQTNLARFGVEYPMQSEEIKQKSLETVQSRYNVRNVFQAESIKNRIKSTNLNKYGVENVSQNGEIKAKATRNSRNSKLELRICSLFDNYHIAYEHPYHISDGTYSHEFDFYIPKYKLLIDADGKYFHCYMGDSDGVRTREDYDEVRLHLIPKDHIFHVIVEGEEDKDLKYITDVLKQIDDNIFDYDSAIFDWCRSVGFPYPSYDMNRLLKDYKCLCSSDASTYNKNCKFGISIVRHYHRSIYDAHVGNFPSPYEAWNDDTLLNKVITNRLIYKNNVDPSKILAGFNISKICPRVSVFNPVLARYLTLKYLNEFSHIFDPFSGYSGRLIGVSSTGKFYIGQDLNINAVNESNKIITDMGLNAEVSQKDILDSEGEYECLLTCPPYNRKEVYNAESVFKSCDDWISECLNRFRCKKYVFVVDETSQYRDYIAEEIRAESHFVKFTEKVIVLSEADRNQVLNES